MPNGFKIAKFIGGMIEVIFFGMFMYECGKEAGKKEYALQASLENQNSISVDDIREFLNKIDKDTVEKSC
jgi:hypothetical protein